MKAHFLLAIVGAAATPVVVHQTLGPLDASSFGGDSDLMTRAEEIARERFSTSANLSVERVWLSAERTGSFGERIRPDPGYAFHNVQARITNTGHMDFAVSTWHFSGVDDAGSDHGVELANAHEDFDASRLGQGHSRAGIVIFELQKGSYLTQLRWQGELGETNATVAGYDHS